MYRTFNMGMGYVFIAPEEESDRIAGMVPGAKVAGRITAEEGVRLEGETFV